MGGPAGSASEEGPRHMARRSATRRVELFDDARRDQGSRRGARPARWQDFPLDGDGTQSSPTNEHHDPGPASRLTFSRTVIGTSAEMSRSGFPAQSRIPVRSVSVAAVWAAMVLSGIWGGWKCGWVAGCRTIVAEPRSPRAPRIVGTSSVRLFRSGFWLEREPPCCLATPPTPGGPTVAGGAGGAEHYRTSSRE